MTVSLPNSPFGSLVSVVRVSCITNVHRLAFVCSDFVVMCQTGSLISPGSMVGLSGLFGRTPSVLPREWFVQCGITLGTRVSGIVKGIVVACVSLFIDRMVYTLFGIVGHTSSIVILLLRKWLRC